MYQKKSKTIIETALERVPQFEVLVDKLTKSFSINGKSTSTLTNYLRCLGHLALYYKISPELLETEAIDDYLYHCQKLHKTPSESFFKHTIYGLRSAYKVMGMEQKRLRLPQIKRQRNLPIVLNKKEVRQLLASPKYLKHRLILGMLYGCGLRSYELCNLLLSDIDFERKTVFIKKKKGKTDRYVPLSDHLARGLKKYFSSENPKKYVFNSQVTDGGLPLGITTRGIYWIVKESRSKVATKKKYTAHTLRHSYATHLLEDGLNIISLKELLGHAHIETTMVYLHVANTGSSDKFSPLDTLYNK
ncbi:tyrosine-type recombinase/integrase [Tenacibaculum dicentrarchi]|nr:tyrosine-type recombinase/integrase [Tenacibaculum dicentrarchi]MCD8421224.1 tyrosine-type recombinase/integrase [Tenacibaculum dicentrarchi]MCD8450388.1 tyrosine-type recombinase/integrase [Tenacibaculum dicentrarchi]MCD8450392.1 tyrosine-type recombinase/integrase [Tenacibaculum dicentrarchi]